MACVPLASLCCVCRPGARRPHELPGTGRQGQPAALPCVAAPAAGTGTAVGDDRGIRLRPVQAVPQRCRLGLAASAGWARLVGLAGAFGFRRIGARSGFARACCPPWRCRHRRRRTSEGLGVDLRADRLAGHRHHLGGDPHRGDALRRPGRPGRHRCHRSAEHPRPRRDAGVFVPGQPHRADRLCRRFLTGSAPGGAGCSPLRLQAGEGRGSGRGGRKRPEALPIGAQRPAPARMPPLPRTGEGERAGAVACPVLLAWPFHLVAVAAGDRFQRRASRSSVAKPRPIPLFPVRGWPG